MDIFAKKTNIEIKNRFISFDISELPRSIQTTGYLVVLEHIMNRLKRNIPGFLLMSFIFYLQISILPIILQKYTKLEEKKMLFQLS